MGNSILFLLTLLVGFCLPIMAYSNALLSKNLGSPFTATLAVFILASVLIGVITAFARSPPITLGSLNQTNWKMWLGGFIVVMNIITFTIVPQKIGPSNMIVIFITGQICSSVIAEHFGLLNFPVHSVNWQRIVGILRL